VKSNAESSEQQLNSSSSYTDYLPQTTSSLGLSLQFRRRQKVETNPWLVAPSLKPLRLGGTPGERGHAVQQPYAVSDSATMSIELRDNVAVIAVRNSAGGQIPNLVYISLTWECERNRVGEKIPDPHIFQVKQETAGSRA
jgi:hypothetical protein